MVTIEQFRAACVSQDGTSESPNNNVKYNTWFYGHPVNGQQYAWCAVFMSWVWIVACGGELLHYGLGTKGSAGVAQFRLGFQRMGKWGHEARVGAFVCFGQDAHIGWVDELTPNGFWFWSGNTGQGSYNNGGGVHRFFVNYQHPPEPIEGYCYPDYSNAPTPTPEDDLTTDQDARLTALFNLFFKPGETGLSGYAGTGANLLVDLWNRTKNEEGLKAEFEQHFPPPVQPK